jgi:hypothetical protein
MLIFDKKQWTEGMLVVSDNCDIIDVWCNTCAGKKYIDWVAISKWNGSLYHFKMEETRLAFILTWGDFIHKKEQL